MPQLGFEPWQRWGTATSQWQHLRPHWYIGIKIEPGSCVGKPKAEGVWCISQSRACRPSAVRCIRPPEALGFPTQLPGEVLMAIISWKNIFCCLIFGKSAFNLWKPGLFQKLFTYGCHDNVQGEQMTLKTLCSSLSCTVWQDSNVYTLL